MLGVFNNMEKFMKKLLISLLMVSSTAAFAGKGDSVSFEVEHEGVTTAGVQDVDSFSIIPATTLDNGLKLDLKLQGSQSNGNGTTGFAVEPRASYAWDLENGFAVGIRGSIGEKFASVGNYGFYTIEPFATYAINNKWTAKTSLKYKDAFGERDIQTETFYLGASYAVDKKNSLYAKAYHRFDSLESNGVEAGYTIGF